MFTNNKYDKQPLQEVLIKASDLEMGVPKSNKKITTFGGLLKEMHILPAQPTVHDDDPPPKEGILKKKKKKKKGKKRSFQRKAKKRINKCWKRFVIFVNSVKAMFARVLYILHALLTIWRCTVLIGEWYWIIGSWLGFMVVEAGFVIFKRHGREWKWIQPCILVYLMVELPSIWILELANLNEVQNEKNMSNPIMEDILAKHRNTGETSVAVAGLSISNDWWALLLEQSMLVLIIIARWLMPKGDMTRDQLSGLLLFYLGTASDIVDFFSVISEDSDLSSTNYTFLFTIMTFWTWSIFQFVFLVTMTKDEEEHEEGEKKHDEDDPDHEHHEKTGSTENLLDTVNKSGKIHLFSKDKDDDKDLTFKERAIKNFKIFLASEVWAILVSVIFQDGPYAIIRVICLFHWNIRTYTNYFFTFKNIMILILQIYRLIAVYQEHVKSRKEAKKKRKAERKMAWKQAIAQATKHGQIDEHEALLTPVGASSSGISGILRRRDVNKNTTKTNIGGLTVSQALQDTVGESGFQIDDESATYRISVTSVDTENSDSGDLTEVTTV